MAEEVQEVLDRLRHDVLLVAERFVRDQCSEMGPGLDERPRRSKSRASDPEALLIFGLDLTQDLPDLSVPLSDWIFRCTHRFYPARLERLGTTDFKLPENREQVDHAARRLDHFPLVNLAFRLRSVLGLTCRAEVIRVLLGAYDRPMSIGRITEAVALSERQVRRVLWELNESGLVHAHHEPPLFRFSINAGVWSGFMEIKVDSLPEYVHWPEYFKACSNVLRWLRFVELTGMQEQQRLLLSTENLLISLRRPFFSRAGPGPCRPLTDDLYWNEFADYIQMGLSLLDD